MDVILFSIKLNEICVKLKTNGLKDDFEILEYFSGEDFFAVFNYKYRMCMKIAGAMSGMKDFSVVCHWQLPCHDSIMPPCL